MDEWDLKQKKVRGIIRHPPTVRLEIGTVKVEKFFFILAAM